VKRITFHGCRHTAATLQLLTGVPPVVVALQLGHSVDALLKIYAHALPDAKRILRGVAALTIRSVVVVVAFVAGVCYPVRGGSSCSQKSHGGPAW
jgi:integrase-like protein